MMTCKNNNFMTREQKLLSNYDQENLWSTALLCPIQEVGDAYGQVWITHQ